MYLAIDTSTRKALIALMDDDEFIEHRFDHKQTQKVIYSELANILDPETLADLDGIAVGTGPGSFTGVKIGVITAKTLSWARGLPLVGISSLDVIAAGIEVTDKNIENLVVTVPSTRGEIYLKTYSLEGNEWNPSSPIYDLPLNSEKLREILPTSHFYISGEAGEQLADILDVDRFILVDENFRYPSAGGFYKLSGPRFDAGDLDDPLTLVPDYIRLSQPERLVNNGTD